MLDIKLPEGTVIGNWAIKGELGRGGQGIVWAAKSRTTKRHPPKALKACFAADPTERMRFEREIKLLHSCQGMPHILSIADADGSWQERIPGIPPFAFYVSEQCEGSLEERVAKLGDARYRIDIFREACAAVEHLHTLAEPVIHRDIKPANFLIAPEPRRVVLADFGIARQLSSDEELTQAQEVVGSQHFRAPEVLACHPPTLLSDIYSLGRVFEWLLTGDVSRDLGTRRIPRGDRLSDEACEILDNIITKATKLRTIERYQSIKEMLNDLPDLWLAVRPQVLLSETTPIVYSSGIAAYKNAINIAKTRERSNWRASELEYKNSYIEELLSWRKSNDRINFSYEKSLLEWAGLLVDKAMPRLAFAFGGLASQIEPFEDQQRTFDHLLEIPNWNNGGLVVAIHAPQMIACVFHYLHGSLACELDRFDLALQLAHVQIPVFNEERTKPAWKSWQIAGRPKTLQGNHAEAAKLMKGLFDQQPVLGEIFNSRRDYNISLASYSLMLSLLEMENSVEQTAKLSEEQLHQRLVLEVPPIFLWFEHEEIRAAARRTIGSPKAIDCVARITRTDREQLRRTWVKWKRILNGQQANAFFFELPLGELN